MIKVQIVADSINNLGDRLTSLVLTYPRIIHSEMMTHRMFSRNASSSRAVPIDKMIKAVRENTFCPFEFQKSHKGMQGSEYFTGAERQECVNLWLESAELALQQAEKMKAKGISKQIINRILEPYQYYTALVTATEFENFFKLRCPQYSISELIDGDDRVFKSKKDLLKELDYDPIFPASDLDWLKINKGQAEIHMQALAEAMWDAYNESIPKKLKAGDWHIPFEDKIELIDWLDYVNNDNHLDGDLDLQDELFDRDKLKISTARCARLSYITFDGKIDYEKDIQLHDRLLADNHMSPFEHCARAMSNEEFDLFIKGKLIFRGEENYDLEEPLFKDKGWCNNFRGWINYRYMIENNYY